MRWQNCSGSSDFYLSTKSTYEQPQKPPKEAGIRSRSSDVKKFATSSATIGYTRKNDTYVRNIYVHIYRTKVPNTQIRFRWTSCRGTMHQTLITDSGCPKNRYPDNLSVQVSCANQSVLEFAVSPHRYPNRYPNRYPKAMRNLSGKPSGHDSFGLHHENPYLQPFSCQHQMDQVYVCLVLLSMHFIHVVCLTVSLVLFPLSKLMGQYSKASKEEQCGIRRLRSKIQAASWRCRHPIS